ncbi:mobilome CxxCx(11)CxxC protein [Photobacterium leiognathi]|uniref:mobilome CxxCx(11)CxxC protein n=1 Tax=Photobacterium leiognathi TaxID=553611 RepID=UPI0029818001|nr:mobilome CxxCx(11)CxxC protein [Photobacterium leiognathi]
MEKQEEVPKINRQSKLAQIEHFEFLSYGTAQVFEARVNRLRKLRASLTFLGIVLPVTVGGMYISFSQSKELMTGILSVAGGVGVVQLILSTWALVSGWDSQYELAIKSLQGNTSNFNKCKRFATTEFRSDAEFISVYESIIRDVEQQELVDITQHISKKEKYTAYQESLTYYNRGCHSCNQNPSESSKSKTCSSCGQKRNNK